MGSDDSSVAALMARCLWGLPMDQGPLCLLSSLKQLFKKGTSSSCLASSCILSWFVCVYFTHNHWTNCICPLDIIGCLHSSLAASARLFWAFIWSKQYLCATSLSILKLLSMSPLPLGHSEVHTTTENRKHVPMLPASVSCPDSCTCKISLVVCSQVHREMTCILK